VTPERVWLRGETGSVATHSDLRAYVGIAPELFAANAGFRTFMTAFYEDKRYDGDAFLHQQNPFARRNVTAIVLEVPSELIGKGKNQHMGDDLPLWPCAGGTSFALGPAYGYASLPE
jgi:hypothetical protein